MNEKPDINDLLAHIRSMDGKMRAKAQRTAGPVGAAAIAPLAEIAASSAMDDVVKAARGAIEAITHYAARPGAQTEANAVSVEILKVVQSSPSRQVRVDMLHLLGYIAMEPQTINSLAQCLKEASIRDEARMALEQIPGSASTNALRKAVKDAVPDFRPHLEHSLRNRVTHPKSVGIAPE